MSANVVELDARGLEPPQPLVRVLEAIEHLPPDAELHARTDRLPIHLLGLLQERGFTADCQPANQPDHGYVTIIRHAA